MTYCVAMRLEPRARVRGRYAHQRRRRQHRPVPQDPLLVRAGRPGDRAAGGRQPVAYAVGDERPQRAAGRGRSPEEPNLFNVPSLYRAARLVGDAVREVRPSTVPRSTLAKTCFCADLHPRRPDRRRSRRACSRSIPRATSSRRPTTRPTSRSASTSTASRSSTAWPSPPCAWARRQSSILLSFDSTLRSNLSVGMPIDILDLRARQPRLAPREAHRGGRRVFQEALERLVRGARVGIRQDRRVRRLSAAHCASTVLCSHAGATGDGVISPRGS